MKNSRRKFLINGLRFPMAMTGASILPIEKLLASNPTEEEYDCIVLGAGLSGLTAARDLVAPGVHGDNAPYLKGKLPSKKKVLILEGNNSIGGRIRTNKDFFPGANLECGAENIHSDPGKTPLWLDVYRFGLKMKHFKSVKRGLVHNRRFVSNLGEKLNFVTAGAFTGLGTNIFNGPSEAAKAGNLEEWRDKISGKRDLYYEVVRALFNSPGALEDNHFGGFLKDQYDLMMKNQFETKIWSGIFSIIEHMAAEVVSHGVNIHLNHFVTSVNYTKNGVEIECIHNGEKKVFRAKTAISSFAVGMLKTGKVQFNPPLPQQKVEALRHLAVGNSTKMMIKFTKRFWPDNMSFVMETDPDFDRHDKNKERPIRLAGRVYFQTGSQSGEQVPILTTLISDEDGNRLLKLDHREVFQLVCKDLDRIFAQQLEGQSCLDLVEKDPSNGSHRFFVKNWSRDPFSNGANTYFLAGKFGVKAEDVREILASCESTPNLFWTGADMSTDARPSSLDGAHASGLRVAYQVHKLLDEKRLTPISETDKLYAAWLSDPRQADKFIKEEEEAEVDPLEVE